MYRRVGTSHVVLVITAVFCLAFAFIALNTPAVSAWPAASLEGRQANCLSCHEENNRWSDESQVVIDIVDPATGASYRQPDGSFLIRVRRNSELRIKSVFGVDPSIDFPPDMVGWLYVSPDQLQSAPEASLKFAPGWAVNRPFCGKRLVERVAGYEGDKMAAITMTISPSDAAGNAEVDLQVLFKSLARGMEGTYFSRRVVLQVVD